MQNYLRGLRSPSSRARLSRRNLACALGVLIGLGGVGTGVVLPRVAFAQTVDLWNWKSVNLRGMGYVSGISIAPQSPYDVYVRTDVGGAYRYDRTGDKWVPLFDMYDTTVAGGGVGVESIAADPSNNSRVYAAINYAYGTTVDQYGSVTYNYGGEIMVSTNKGQSWTPMGLATNGRTLYVGPNSEYRNTTGERIGVDPNKGDLVFFASSQGGLWKKDGTAAWTRLSSGLPAPDSLPGYYARGYYDAAQSDNSPNTNFPGYTFVLFDKSTGSSGNASQTVYLGVWGSGVYKSTNGGASWSLMSGSYQYPRRGVIASNGTLYVTGGTDGGVKQSNGTGFPTYGTVFRCVSGTWTEIRPSDTGSDYGIYTGVTVDPAAPGTVIVARARNIWRSTNSGTSWGAALKITNSNGSLNGAPAYYSTTVDADSGVAGMFIDPASSSRVWWTNGWGVAKTENITAAPPVWTFTMNNLEELDGNMVRVPPKAGGAAVWLATQDKIGFRLTGPDTTPGDKFNPIGVKTDPNNTWANGTATTFASPFPHVAGATGIDYCYTQPDKGVFVGFHQWQNQDYGPYTSIHGKTTDNGVTWNALPAVPTENLYISWASVTKPIKATGGMVAMSPTDANRMVWAPSGGVWPHYTTDGGATWNLCYNLSHGAQPSPYDANNMDHTHYDKLPKAWSLNISQWLSSAVLAADRADTTGKTFYYYTGFDFYYSTDGGANWTTSQSNSLLPDWITRATVAPNPLTKGDVWLACARNANTPTTNPLYRSTNGGQTFSAVSGVTSAEFIAFGKHPTSFTQPTLYLWGRVNGATKDAMYKTDDLGATWVRLSDPNTTQFTGIINMDADMRTANLLYLATTGRGFHYGTKSGGGTDTAKYNFEAGVQGWLNAWGSATPSVSTAQKNAGAQSLGVAVGATAAGDNAVRVLYTGSGTPMPGGGTSVTFRVYVPTGALVDSVYAFSQDANWGNWGQSTLSPVTKGQWNTITLTVPSASVSPLNAIGVNFHTTGAWSGTCYVDSVNW